MESLQLKNCVQNLLLNTLDKIYLGVVSQRNTNSLLCDIIVNNTNGHVNTWIMWTEIGWLS